MKKLPDISLNDFPEYAAEIEKMSKLESERRDVKDELAAVEVEIAELKSKSKADAAEEYLATGNISPAGIETLRERYSGLSQRLTILNEAKRQQSEKISRVLVGIKIQLRERYEADYGELERRRILALCEAGVIQAEMEKFASHLSALHPTFHGIFGVIRSRVDVSLRDNNEGMASQIMRAIEAGHLSIKEVPQVVSDVLGIPAKMKARTAWRAELNERPEDRKARVEAEQRAAEAAAKAKKDAAILAARYR